RYESSRSYGRAHIHSRCSDAQSCAKALHAAPIPHQGTATGSVIPRLGRCDSRGGYFRGTELQLQDRSASIVRCAEQSLPAFRTAFRDGREQLQSSPRFRATAELPSKLLPHRWFRRAQLKEGEHAASAVRTGLAQSATFHY